MDARSKVLLVIVGIITLLSIASLFYEVVVLKDFEVLETTEETEVETE